MVAFSRCPCSSQRSKLHSKILLSGNRNNSESFPILNTCKLQFLEACNSKDVLSQSFDMTKSVLTFILVSMKDRACTNVKSYLFQLPLKKTQLFVTALVSVEWRVSVDDAPSVPLRGGKINVLTHFLHLGWWRLVLFAPTDCVKGPGLTKLKSYLFELPHEN